nr:hypothetical protein [Steroidobacter gossypii]
MLNLARLRERGSQFQLPLQNLQRASTQCDVPILAGLGAVLLLAEHDGLVDRDSPLGGVAVVNGQGDLL